MNNKLKPFLPHIIAIVIFLVVAAAFFSPALSGYEIKQHDNNQAIGYSNEAKFYHEQTGEYTEWTNALFSGMPTYQVGYYMGFDGNISPYLHKIIFSTLPSAIAIWFLYAIGFYILARALKIDYRIAIIGAIAYAFSAYLIIIMDAGHVIKAWAIGYAAPALAGLVYLYRGKLLRGFCLLAVFFALELYSNHVQMTYYFGILFLFYVLGEFFHAIQKKEFKTFFQASALAVAGVAIAVMCSFNNLYVTSQYVKNSTRGQSELTIGLDGKPNAGDQTAGLDRSYVTAWSYGIDESWSTFIPNTKGGLSKAVGADNKALSKADPQFKDNIANSNQYWGDQNNPNGPNYAGAIVVLLFVLGMFFVKNRIKWAIFAASILVLMLSWGKHFMGLTDFFLDNVPLYDKFRAVSSILVVLGLCLPLLGVLFINELIENREEFVAKDRKLLYVGGGVVALLLVFWIMPDTFFDFISLQETEALNQQVTQQPDMATTIQAYVNSLKNVRIDIFKSDVLRTLFFVVAAFALIYAYVKKGFKPVTLIVGLGLLMLIDQFVVNKRYLQTEKVNGEYVKWEKPENHDYPFTPGAADLQILQSELSAPQADGFTAPAVIAKKIEENVAKRKSNKMAIEGNELADVQFSTLGQNTNYRVLNLTVSPFNDASTSYFHKSIGGYHGAKLKRYQELIEFHMSSSLNPEVLNMLNAKYIITQNGLQQNPLRCGNAWFVGNIKVVNNSNEEILALKDFQAKETVIVDKQYASLAKQASRDSSASIREIAYQPNKLTYESNAGSDQIAVFSEIYYPGWKATIDGKPVDHFRCDYVLRGLQIPAGKHKIEFTFQSDGIKTATSIGYAGSILLGLLILSALFFEFKPTAKGSEEL